MRRVTPEQRRAFIRAHTTVGTAPLVPEIRLHLAGASIPLWEALEATEGRRNLPPPYWAWAWPGGQVLARYVLENPALVRARRVLDFASGCGVSAFAAMRAGAASVVANEIDPVAVEACRLNAELNGVVVESVEADFVGTDAGWDVVLAGDVCYERPMAARVEAWLRGLAGRGAVVLMGDPGRNYLPRAGIEEVARWRVPTSRELEDRDERDTRVFRVRG